MPQHSRFNIDDTVRNEGNAAHWLIEQVHKRIHGTDELVNCKAPNGIFITEEMIEHVTPFLEAIRGKGMVECVTSYGDGQNYQVNGRADWLDYEPSAQLCTLYVDDFKYGWGIIEPKDNWTLISHALGWIFKNPNLPVHSVVFRIYQPRPHHPLGKMREAVYTIDEIHAKWEELKAALSNPKETLNTSNHCKDCPALVACPAAQKAGMNAVDVSEALYVADVDNANLAFLLDQIDRAIKVLESSKKAYGELALHRLKKGEIVPGYGTEKDLTNKQWKEGITVETAKLITGKDLSKNQLVTPAQAVRAGVDESIIDTLCERREKGVKLAKMDANVIVKKLFAGLK